MWVYYCTRTTSSSLSPILKSISFNHNTLPNLFINRSQIHVNSMLMVLQTISIYNDNDIKLNFENPMSVANTDKSSHSHWPSSFLTKTNQSIIVWFISLCDSDTIPRVHFFFFSAIRTSNIEFLNRTSWSYL